jgi:hypothetical protein
MSHNLIHEYLDQIEELLRDVPNTYIEQFYVTILGNDRANLRLRIRFNLTYLLAVSEIILIENDRITYLDYRYHFQDGQNMLILRYDNTPHFPDLSSFPHHKHLVHTVIECQKPTLEEVLQEILSFDFTQ